MKIVKCRRQGMHTEFWWRSLSQNIHVEIENMKNNIQMNVRRKLRVGGVGRNLLRTVCNGGHCDVSGVEPAGSATRKLLRPFAFCLSLVLSGSSSKPLSDPGVPFCTYCHGKHSPLLWTGDEPTPTHTDAVWPALCPPPVVSRHAAAAVRQRPTSGRRLWRYKHKTDRTVYVTSVTICKQPLFPCTTVSGWSL